MQDFRWTFTYSAIFMVWCAGYLDQAELVAFLRRAKEHLIVDGDRRGRSFEPESFIFVLDNVQAPGEGSVFNKGQRVRNEAELEAIFAAAGLLVHRHSGQKEMPGNFRDVVVWALF